MLGAHRRRRPYRVAFYASLGAGGLVLVIDPRDWWIGEYVGPPMHDGWDGRPDHRPVCRARPGDAIGDQWGGDLTVHTSSTILRRALDAIEDATSQPLAAQA